MKEIFADNSQSLGLLFFFIFIFGGVLQASPPNTSNCTTVTMKAIPENLKESETSPMMSVFLKRFNFLRVPSFQGVTRQDFGMAIGSPTSENLLGRLFCTGNEFRMPF
ncbi:MAG: hypothetical protein PHV34_24680, partial [Verrucomicrobiae bacterium]|nr:hypothetical protein [Verrucomicrobiae bacterium]